MYLVCGSPHPRPLCQCWLGKAITGCSAAANQQQQGHISSFSIEKALVKHAEGVFVESARTIFGFKTVVPAGSATKSGTDDPSSTVVNGVHLG